MSKTTPFVLKGDNVAYFDVDDTLVIWSIPQDTPIEDLIAIGTDDFSQNVLIHRAHVEQLKRHKARGHQVVVWSQGGYEWALAVVRALGIEEHVDAVMRKPSWYWDDLPARAFMGEPAYIHPYEGFKRRTE